ncbi:MAG: cytochrome P450 [Trichodesmium sp. MAG_R04]|nr:cytochrome P450 [Trichodesmium sp. MAG_R04]
MISHNLHQNQKRSPLSSSSYILLFGEYSMLYLSGDRHRREHETLMPPFHDHRMGKYGELICKISKQAASNLTVSQAFIACKLTQEIMMQVILQQDLRSTAIYGV